MCLPVIFVVILLPNFIEKIESAGFKIVKSTSFVTTLLPAMLVSRLLPEKVFDAASEFKISPWLNSLFYRLLRAELAFIKKVLIRAFSKILKY
jgi:hypothetical protein